MNCLCRRILSTSIMRIMIHRNIIRTASLLLCSEKNYLKSSNYQYIDFHYIRHKSKKANDKEDDDETYNEDDSLKKDSKVVKFNTGSMRTDLILKTALGVARNKIEQQFYESKIRINGKKVLKKSASVRVGDEIDVIKGVSPKNPNHIYVSRIEILNAVANEDNITVTARRFKSLLIENYDNDVFSTNTEE